MKRAARLVAVAGLLAGLSGCGGGGGIKATEVSCGWAASAGNCWTATVAAAHACVDQGLTGTWQGGGTSSCTYPDGVQIAFDHPAADALDFTAPLAFTVSAAGGATCARYVETDTTVNITTSLGTFKEEFSLALDKVTVLFTCPDGSHFRIPDAGACQLSDFPGWAASSSNGTIQFSLLHAPPADPSFWTCAPPPP